MLGPVALLGPLLGLLILMVEALALVAVYAIKQPASGSWFNVIVGTIGLLSMIAMLVYSVARRSKLLRNVMRLSLWLQLHIFLGLQGILFAFVHCLPILWREGWPILVNPGMLNLYAVMVVFASGVFGRYLYAQVPKTIGGQHLASQAVDAEIEALGTVPDEVRALWANAPHPRGFFGVVRAGFARGRALRKLGRMKLPGKVKVLAYRRVMLEYQKAAMIGAQRVFRYWIVLHRPIALALYLLSFVHVTIAVLFSTHWEWW
jgi:hypothetical protein